MPENRSAVVSEEAPPNKGHIAVPRTGALSLAFRLLLVGAVCLWVANHYLAILVTGKAFYHKLQGVPVNCSYASLSHIGWDALQLEELYRNSKQEVDVVGEDESLKIVQVRSQERRFWAPAGGSALDGKLLIAYLLAEHRFMEQANPNQQVQPGSVVVDVGGHVGVFTHFALKRGAAKVIAFEPQPTNAACFKRNLKNEIDSGRVILIEKGLWSSGGVLKLYTGGKNSGMASMVLKDSESYVEVPVVTLDQIVDELKLERVDYIKMDIEGAEREALAGSVKTMKNYRPVVMLDFYHRPDDPQVLPGLLKKAHADYSMTCGPCEFKEAAKSASPHVAYFH